MIKKTCLQTRLIVIVFVLMSGLIILVTFLTAVFEKNRFQQRQLNRIYDETCKIPEKIAPFVFVSNHRIVMDILSTAKSVSPSILYYTVTDMNGTILASDDEKKIGKHQFETVTLKEITKPLFERFHGDESDKSPGWFRIYRSQLNIDLYDEKILKAQKNETLFDAFWDITHSGENIGTLRIGVSKQGQQKLFSFLIGGILGTAFLVLFITLGVVLRVVSKSMKPMDDVLLQLSELQSDAQGRSLRRKLSTIDWNQTGAEIQEIQRLKQTVLKLRDLFIHNWDQLESREHHLEKKVDQKTRELKALKKELILQIEERKEIETRLLNVQKLEAISTLAGGIAHEFNNLFMAITGYASLIQAQSEPGHPNAVKAEKIKKIVDNGSQSIKQLLGFARSGKYTAGALNLNEVLRINVEMFRRTRRDITVVVNYTVGIWHVHADRSQMDHVIMNLLINASEAMPDTGRVMIETHNIVLEKKKVSMDKIVSGRFVHLSIQDQGKGIKAEHIQRVFDPFFTTKPMSAGTGLGLASVYGIINNHGGFTTVESHVGKGTVFSVFLPAVKKEKNT